MKYQQIIDIFTDFKKLKEKGIWFDGKEWEGEYKQWHRNGQIWIHCFYIDKDKYRDEYKLWYDNGKTFRHRIYNKDGSLKEKIV